MTDTNQVLPTTDAEWRERLTPDEVMTSLREQGVAHLRDVRHAYMEGDGRISVLRYDGEPPSDASRPDLLQ